MPLTLMPGTATPPELQVRAPGEIRALLRDLVRQAVPVTLAGPDGTHYTTTPSADDADRDVLVLPVDPADARVRSLVEGDEVVAVAYLDQVKLQFDLQGLMLVHGHNASALQAHLPQTLYRFQRRGGFRVRAVGPLGPEVQLRLPEDPDTLRVLRVFDLSHGGVALHLRPGEPALPVGTHLAAAALVLDPSTVVQVALRVVHATPMGEDGREGLRLGCEIEGLSGVASRTLQRYIDRTQKRQRMLLV
jgi:c-di-GMP-binding flagellar brake protein YcgR